MIQRLATVLAVLATAVALSVNASAGTTRPATTLVAQAPTPTYVTWYNVASPWPSPITSAYVGIGGALGAGNIYNTATNGFGSPGTGVLGTNSCAFLCYGVPGVASSNVIAVGNDVSSPNPYSFTTIGAPDDCSTSGPRLCPGGISDQVFSIEGYVSPTATPTVLVAIDASANFAVFNNIYAGAAVVAGAGTSPNPVPSPSPGSLVSYTGTSEKPDTGDILLGSSGNYVKCDYGESAPNKLTCNAPLNVNGPVKSAVSTTATLGPVGPCYAYNGSPCASTFHVVKNSSGLDITTSGACANDIWCALNNASISISGSNAQFANDQYSCSLSSLSTYLLNLLANNQTTTGFEIQAYNNSGSSIASGTDLGIAYACFGT